VFVFSYSFECPMCSEIYDHFVIGEAHRLLRLIRQVQSATRPVLLGF